MMGFVPFGSDYWITPMTYILFFAAIIASCILVQIIRYKHL
jgi:hypothetical protein